MLFAADVYTNLMGLGDPVGFQSCRKAVRTSASLPVFHSMLPGSAMARDTRAFARIEEQIRDEKVKPAISRRFPVRLRET
jgi:hypothetical protein